MGGGAVWWRFCAPNVRVVSLNQPVILISPIISADLGLIDFG